ncbi:serine threonine- kinase Nek9 [Brachionus plicatilis]|uniref:non-specific serine/threonine protein kinase n=1 Tax=Brachionus plicatilis TaxID=10195 RepID=A0A3M7QI58_BRAPC|nr:serine threonine- kinase Nek9 [Brachionus plicatilis]
MEESDLYEQTDETYVYVKFLGEGSFGKVNLYRKLSDNSLIVWKEIALKRLEAKFRQEAFSEVEILSMLDHPNIISYYKHFIEDEILYIELEYAKAGTLAAKIKQKKNSNEIMDEQTVLWYMYQLTSAVDYIHDLGIMHRDIKTLNIFFMHSDLLKLGDFGIAKILDQKNAYLQTLVGTPFYLSPEIVEGKKYSYKSDIWALGCVVYEMMTLSRVFDATNQLKLALKISQCNINDIEADYSTELKDMIKIIFSKDPEQRPSAQEILQSCIFNSNSCQFREKIENLDSQSKKLLKNLSISTQVVSSKLSEVYTWGGGTRLPKRIDLFQRECAALSVSLGRSHFAVVTVEKELFTWSASQGGPSYGSYSKLGHGKNFGTTRIPKQVESLTGLFVEKVSCGEEMTCCLTHQGQVYTFGSNLYGCLGLGLDHELQVYTPTKIQFFEDNHLIVKSIACGDYHVIALTQDNRVFTWGCGEYGRLGHGDEDDQQQPKEIKFDFKYKFRQIYAGSDYSFLMTKEGRVLAFGNNEHNKLCLNEYTIGLKNPNSHVNIQENSLVFYQQLKPKLVKKFLSYKIAKICPGHDHTAFIDIYGRLFTFGSNNHGQLGLGDTKSRVGPNQVCGPLSGHFVTHAACGDTFSICSTSEKHIFSWGNRNDGRLGLDYGSSSSSGTVCLPKPIFGSLYLVSEMCSRNWNSVIIAEKELDSKLLKSVSYVDFMKDSSDKVSLKSESGENNECGDESTCQKRDFNMFDCYETNDDVPEWLKKDFEDADFIPIEALERSSSRQDILKEASSLEKKNPHEINNLEEAIKIIEQLKEENEKLKQENLELKEKKSSLNKST